METITFQDIINQLQDILQNYSITTIDQANVYRAANRGIEYVQRRLGLPSDTVITPFWYYEDQQFYNCVDAFNELIGVYYNTSSISTPTYDNNYFRNKWFIYKDIELLKSTGRLSPQSSQNRVAFTTINGSNQLLMVGKNTTPGQLICPFNTTTGLTFSTSITSAATDSNVYITGGSSVVFNVTNAESASTISFTGLWDIRQLVNNNGVYRLYVDFPLGTVADFSSIQLELISSTGNYYSISTTTNYDGTAWNNGTGWSKLGFNLSNATTVGTVVASAITQINVILNHSGGFTNVSNFRINALTTITPDYLNCMSYSAYKGTDTTGATKKVILTTGTDILSFGNYAYDLIYIVCMRAALIGWPQLRGDMNFWQMYKADFEDVMKIWSKTYPRTRNVFGQSTELVR